MAKRKSRASTETHTNGKHTRSTAKRSKTNEGHCVKDQPIQEPEGKALQFAFFERLPHETKQAIWSLAVQAAEPRVVEIWQGYRDDRGQWTGEFTSPCPIPGLLHACRDSRRLAMTRWKLCFAHEKQPAKIFFDLTSDILYFGPAFDCLETFTVEGNKADRRAVCKIAFNLFQQWDSEYYETGDDLAVKMRREFPALDHIVFVGRDVMYDWERHEMGRAQKRTDPRKTVITFCPPLLAPEDEDGTASEFVAKYAQRKWVCPKVDHMDYKKSRPDSPDRPVERSDNENNGDWDEHVMKTEKAGKELSFDEDFPDDEDDCEVGGWLNEVPDLQLRMVLMMYPELRSQFGF